MDAYDVYCQWCRDIGRPEPTRDWWNATGEPDGKNDTGELTARRLALYIRHPLTTPEEAENLIETFANCRASARAVEQLKATVLSLEKALAPRCG